MRILLIEDNPGDARLVQETLKETPGNFAISAVERLGLGLDLLLSQDVDVVLLDLNLPDSRGLKTLAELQTRFSHLPIVVMTSTDDEELACQAVRLGAQDYLVKGNVDNELLRRALTYAIERKRGADAILRVKEEWERTFDSVPDLIAILDDQHRILRVNKAMAARLVCTPEQCVGLHCYKAVHGTDAPPAFCPHAKTLADQREHIEEVREDRLGGDFLVSTNPILDSQGRMIGSVHVARDITELKRREEKIIKLTRLYAVLSRANEAIVRIGDANSLCSEICRIVAEEGGFPLVWIGQVEEQQVVPLAWSGPAVDYLRELKVEVQGELGRGPTGTCIRENRAVVNDDFATNTTVLPWRETALSYSFRASAAFPLHCEDKVTGALTLYSFEPNTFDADQIRLLESLGSDVSYALDSIGQEKRRIQAEETLRESEERLNRAQEIAHVGSWELDLLNNRLTWSDEVYRIFGLQPQEFRATYEAFLEAVHPDDRAAVEAAYSGSIREGRDTYEIEHRIVRRSNGQVRIVFEKCQHFRDTTGRIIRSVGMVHDITERKQAEEQLKFQADILTHIFDAVVAVDNDYRVTYWNKVAEDLYGIPAEQAIGHRQEDLYQYVWLNPKNEQDSAEDLAAKGHWTGENIQIKKTGERVYVRSSISVMTDQDGMQIGMVAVTRDRTGLWQAEQELKILNEKLRQQAEDRLRATDASFRRAITSSADGIVVIRKDGVIRFANPAAEGLLGREAVKMVGTSFGFPIVEATEIEIPKENGRKAIAEMRVVELDWEDTPAYLATLRDITRRKEGLLALQESETRLRLLLGQIPCLTWTLDTTLRFTSFTGSGSEVPEAVPDQILGMTLAEYFKVDELDFTPYVAHRQALQGTPTDYELSWAGRTFYGRVESLSDADDHIVGVVGVAFDITERKRTEEQLRNLSHRLVTAQENERRKIARELHDEVGQSLTALKLYLDRASPAGSTGDGSDLETARETLRELLARVRSMSVELRPNILDELGLLPTLLWHFKRYTAQTNVHVHFKHRGLRRDLPQDTMTTAYRIVQEALTNVARYAQVTEVTVCVRADLDALIIEVEDRGVGFDLEKVAPTSMGLSGMRERALSLKGKLLVQSASGEGTCVIADLPLAKRGRKRKGQRKR